MVVSAVVRIDIEKLSSGEKQLLATSLIWGMAKASGKLLPVIIDTPLGRLDSNHRENLVNFYFPNASHQVLLFSTDQEIHGRYYESLKPFISYEYEISFDDVSNQSKISADYPFKEMLLETT